MAITSIGCIEIKFASLSSFKNSFKCVEAILFTAALFLSSCSQINNQPEIVNDKPTIESRIIFSQDSLRAIITTGGDFFGLEKLILEAQTPLPATYFIGRTVVGVDAGADFLQS